MITFSNGNSFNGSSTYADGTGTTTMLPPLFAAARWEAGAMKGRL